MRNPSRKSPLQYKWRITEYFVSCVNKTPGLSLTPGKTVVGENEADLGGTKRDDSMPCERQNSGGDFLNGDCDQKSADGRIVGWKTKNGEPKQKNPLKCVTEVKVTVCIWCCTYDDTNFAQDTPLLNYSEGRGARGLEKSQTVTVQYQDDQL